jgi:hypothetical protein
LEVKLHDSVLRKLRPFDFVAISNSEKAGSL